MKKALIIIAVLVVVGIGAYYLIYNKNTYGPQIYPPHISTPTSTPKTSASNSPNPSAANVTINIQNFSFNPSTLTIKTGTKVTWVNNDSVSHTVTSDSGNLLNSPTLAPSQSFSFTFINPGSTNYHCSIHPTMMKGVILVTN